MNETEQVAGMSDAAVQAKTGKTWSEWLVALDAAGAATLDHKSIVAILNRDYPEVGGWWMQMVTVGYERARGLRDKHQKPDGYEASASKTIAVPLERLYAAWADPDQRNTWLDAAAFTVRSTTPNKSVRVAATGGRSSIDVRFYPKGDGKSQVTVQHSKLANADEAQRMKTYWGDVLARLQQSLQA